MPADWQLPPGVSRSLWDYFHDAAIARGYDQTLQDTPLFVLDKNFVLEHCRPSGRLIDLGCGTGRLSITLAQKWLSACRRRSAPEMLKVLGEKAAALGLEIPRCATSSICACSRTRHSTMPPVCSARWGWWSAPTHGKAFWLMFIAFCGREARLFCMFTIVGSTSGLVRRALLLKEMFGSWLGRQPSGDYQMPPQQGIGPLTMHLFMRSEIIGLLRSSGFDVELVRPLSLRWDGKLCCPWWFGWMRNYGYLIAARKR